MIVAKLKDTTVITVKELLAKQEEHQWAIEAQSRLQHIVHHEMRWRKKKLLWLGYLKNPVESCWFSRIPKELVKLIDQFL
jgi:hypothetical protein